MNKQRDFLSDTWMFDFWVRAWVAASTLVGGFANEAMHPASDSYNFEIFNWGAFIVGLALGALANVPFLILFNLGKKILANLAVLRGVEVAEPDVEV